MCSQAVEGGCVKRKEMSPRLLQDTSCICMVGLEMRLELSVSTPPTIKHVEVVQVCVEYLHGYNGCVCVCQS